MWPMNTFRHVEVPSSAVKPDRYGKAGRMHARLKLDIEFCLLLFRLGLSLSGAVATTARSRRPHPHHHRHTAHWHCRVRDIESSLPRKRPSHGALVRRRRRPSTDEVQIARTFRSFVRSATSSIVSSQIWSASCCTLALGCRSPPGPELGGSGSWSSDTRRGDDVRSLTR
jgi:hypothetical protein|eukprot:COSAG01_NODE_10059_length_2259_cov_27.003704_2_plen_170_part_00